MSFDYVSETHKKMHDVIVEGIEEYDRLSRAEYNVDAAETNYMRQALAWYDKMVENYAEYARRVDSGEENIGVAGLRAEAASIAESNAQHSVKLEDLDGRVEAIEDVIKNFRRHMERAIDCMERD